ncbi:DUF6526 family protein [Flavobacterium johnsoniae]|uniref:Uncharacterized protein n=2 Tax=Flavobacterium johnsoniae TaxID=986 RepID=A0A1M6YDC3_FLAJO|nr:DUF6526 family protein [Flavobacterium johnsoniae]ABQ07331.1 hypothetical protein Fjoh_4323 [Flavobacterium johnsoniae UW101]OXE99242.1 hypothetical protein B0A63_11645 [Flavobacterium johnsoniae UW101]WQG80835.1 DUF6526 family protein [Flavobacterium johnsoniae UW101]SHH14831.1 hypothetical protein SAMN05444388_10778 [Flavobacterium johnsoniae]SHL16306.1 hypothetical protein SAMN05444146_3185 [Flavobacterium johnsoniae]
MKIQTYYNHIRFYTPHHFVYYPVLTLFLASSVYFAFTTKDYLIWTFISVVFVFLFCLAFMLRQHYALILQNRIVRLEMRYRYFTLTGKRLEEFEHKLTDDQIFALRFAPDDEFLPLLEDALKNNLTGDAIKKAIVHWRADYNRV